MRIQTFSISRAYEIRCKLFEPEDSHIKHIIIGVHGFAGDKDSSMLKKLAEHCAPYGMGLLCFDFPAHGSSPVNEELLTVENCKQDLHAVISYAQRRYPHSAISIFATSFGGYITLLCSHSFPAYPLVLRAPAVTMPKLLLETVLHITGEQFKQMGTVKCGFERPILLPYGFLEELEQQQDLYTKPLHQPTLILHGDRDDIVPPEDISRYADLQSSVTLRIIPGADHRFKNGGEMETIISLTKDFLKL